MRVIAGSVRGKRLESLEGLHTRPTTDRVKESVFNLLQPYVYEAKVLDAFAGSGALGIEALSRGAASCVFLENDREAASVVRKNLSATRLSEAAQLFEEDAMGYLARTGDRFSLIFLDPPYDSGLYMPVLSVICERNLLLPGGVISAEHRAGEMLPVPEGLTVIKERKYGKTAIYVIGREDDME